MKTALMGRRDAVGYCLLDDIRSLWHIFQKCPHLPLLQDRLRQHWSARTPVGLLGRARAARRSSVLSGGWRAGGLSFVRRAFARPRAARARSFSLLPSGNFLRSI